MTQPRQCRRWPNRIRFCTPGRAALFAAGFIASGIPTPLSALPEAADPQVRVPRTQYRPAIENYIPFRPVEPRSWLGLNQDVTPKPKSGDQQQR